jgi:Fur family ferric uptake transcriptional regulator
MGSIETKQGEANGRQGEKSAPPIGIACARLKSAGLRVTRPRLAILSALVRLREPASIGQIHAGLGSSRCDLVTVYRCLAAFEAIGLVRRALSAGGSSLFAMDEGNGRRFHVLCRRTQRLVEIDPALSGELGRAVDLVEKALRDRGYTELGHVVEFFGVAPPGPSWAPVNR